MSGRIEEELTAYIDGALSPEDAARVEAALASDPALRELHAKLRGTVQALATLETPDASPSLRRAVLTSLDAPRGGRGWWHELASPARWIPAGAVAAFGVAAAVGMFGRTPESRFEGIESADQLALAEQYEDVDDLDLVGLESADDVDAVLELHTLEVTP